MVPNSWLESIERRRMSEERRLVCLKAGGRVNASSTLLEGLISLSKEVAKKSNPKV